MRSSGVTSTLTSGWVAESWAMIPPDRVSDPSELVERADRVDRERALERRRADRYGPGSADRDHAGHQPRSSMAIASAPALRSSLTRSSIPNRRSGRGS